MRPSASPQPEFPTIEDTPIMARLEWPLTALALTLIGAAAVILVVVVWQIVLVVHDPAASPLVAHLSTLLAHTGPMVWGHAGKEGFELGVNPDTQRAVLLVLGILLLGTISSVGVRLLRGGLAMLHFVRKHELPPT